MLNNMFTLKTTINLNGAVHNIRNKGDYRVILDCIVVFNDEDLTDIEKAQCALTIFYEDVDSINDYEIALKEMYAFIDYDSNSKDSSNNVKMMDWEQDFKYIVAPINRVLGKDIRSMEYLHWWSFLSGYMEIGDCLFAQIIGIRNKKSKGKKLEKWEQDFIKDNYDIINIKKKLTEEEEEWLNFR